MVRYLESVANPEWKALRKALSHGGCLDGRYWIAESPRLLEEAVRSGLAIPRVYASARQLPELIRRYADRIQPEWVQVSPRALQAVSATETSQQVLALVAKPQPAADAFFAAQRLLVVLDRIQDPGNAGAIIRSAEAFGATGMVFLKGSASPDSPKLLRASAGSLFRVPFLQDLSAEALLAHLAGVAIYSASPEATQDIS
ncbi:MAG: RNA methyltransferase, partial [Bryobacterales bacterium]|nr:RNA methyltransferase [Bryobacterales bacterium]